MNSNNIEMKIPFEQNIPVETERKYLPVFPGRLLGFLETADSIRQYYLSHPDEPFSLRLRETRSPGKQPSHVATLKSRGEVTHDGLRRLEVETPIDENIFEYYRALGLPYVTKHRATPAEGVSIDFFADNYIQCESENDASWRPFAESAPTSFIDVTGEKNSDNEWRAHLHYRRRHDGQEGLTPAKPLNISEIASSILEQVQHTSPVVVRIAGRSGSGKSTAIRKLQSILDTHSVESTVLSTDDYHRGRTWLEQHKGSEWTEWDAPIVYDVDTLASDVTKLREGGSVLKRWFDFNSEEPAFGETITARQVIVIEGIYAKSMALDKLSSLTYEIPTPFATCIGRRVLRDLRERPQFADPQKSLRYILEQAEPAYRDQFS